MAALTSSLVGPLTDGEVQAIVARAEGNAFFAEELVGAATGGSAGPGGLPEDLADLLLVRLDRLDDAAREVVRAAACSGRRVSHAMLAAVVGLDDDELDRALRGAVEQNVLARLGDDSYAFRHALLAEAVHDDLLPGERVRLHAAYAAALLERRVDGTAAELARHARAAHDRRTAVQASIQAGEEAMSVGGPEEAAHHYETALELLADDGVADDVDLVGLVTRAADALMASGVPERAHLLVASHLRPALAPADPVDRARLLAFQASASLTIDGGSDPLALTGEALALLPAEPSSLRAPAARAARPRAAAARQRRGGLRAGHGVAATWPRSSTSPGWSPTPPRRWPASRSAPATRRAPSWSWRTSSRRRRATRTSTPSCAAATCWRACTTSAATSTGPGAASTTASRWPTGPAGPGRRTASRPG